MPPMRSGSTRRDGLDLAAGGLLDLVDDLRRLLVGELDGGRQLELEDALLGATSRSNSRVDLLDLGDPALLGEQPEEVADELVRVVEQPPRAHRA